MFAPEPISAAQALAIGLVNRVVPPEELLPQAEEHGMRIAEQAPLAVASSKRALNRVRTELGITGARGTTRNPMIFFRLP